MPRLVRSWRALLQDGSLALFDQAVVSGTNFFTAVIIGRAAGAEELGVYSLALAMLFFIAITQESLISLPYVVYGNRLQGEVRARYAGTLLVHYAVLAGLAVLMLGGLSAALATGIGPENAVPATRALMIVIPFVLLRELGRRVCFAHLDLRRAVGIDLVFAAVQVGGLVALAGTGRLSAVSALGVTGVASGLGSIGWLYVARRSFIVTLNETMREMRRSMKLGGWDLGGQMTNWVNRFGLLWVLAAALDPKATGVFAACMTVVTLSNPFVLGLANMVGPQSARAVASGGHAELWPVAVRSTMFIGTGMALFCIAVALFGDAALVLLYGREFAGNGLVVTVLALAILAWAVGVSAAHGLKALERPDVNFRAGLLGVVITVPLALTLVGSAGVLGVAFGALVGRVVELAVRGTTFVRLVAPQSRVSAPDGVQRANGRTGELTDLPAPVEQGTSLWS